jgi:hypothetical protein
VGEHRGLWFRAFGFGFLRDGNPALLLSVGNRVCGQLFHANHHASHGSLPSANPCAQIAYGAVGLTPLPGIVMALLESLNAACLEAAVPFRPPPPAALRLSDGFISGGDAEEGPAPPPPPLIVRVSG